MGPILVLSDIHRAGARERERRGFDSRAVSNAFLRTFQRVYRRHVWLDDPMAHNHLLDAVLGRVRAPAQVVANGDLTLDTGFVGVSDDAAMESAAEALALLRTAYPGRVRAVIGDHDLGKVSFVGGTGGIRRRSLERCEAELGIPRLWHEDFPGWRWIGVTSSLVAWPVFESESLPEERDWWRLAHAAHLAAVDALFREAADVGQRVLLFCHDPTALPFLHRLPGVRRCFPGRVRTVIGHLHTRLVLRVARVLSGVPRIGWAGHSIRRYTTALREARCWRDFGLQFCPSLTGVQLLKDGGYLLGEMGEELRFECHRLPWEG